MSGDEIKAARRELGLTQERFAEALGVGHSSVRHWEHGRRVPSAPVLYLLERLLNEHRGQAEPPEAPTQAMLDVAKLAKAKAALEHIAAHECTACEVSARMSPANLAQRCLDELEQVDGEASDLLRLGARAVS